MSFVSKFKYKRPLVLGLAKSGTAAASLLVDAGLEVRVNDLNGKDSDQTIQQLRAKGAEIILGAHPLSVLDTRDVVIKNPGISYDHPVLQEAMQRDIPIITEVELAAVLAQGHDMIGVTGSNGKTTTTTLIYEMLAASNIPLKLAGNIGVVATDVARTLTNDEKLLLELSSFQLLGIETFRPHIAVILNIFSAHLDYHQTFANYARAKANIFKNQAETDFLVYNADDPNVREIVTEAKAVLVPFSTATRQEQGAWCDEHFIYFRDEKVMARDNIVLVGDHNLENILAAVAASKLAGATNEGIQQVLMTFTGVKHRLQFVKELKGRLFYNDSKATNMLATQKALLSFTQPIILLAGGLDRGDDFTSLIPYLRHVKACVLFGETKEKLARVAKAANIRSISFADDVDEATRKAYAISEPNDVILLSPACASWDQYRTFEERGEIFIRAVHTLK